MSKAVRHLAAESASASGRTKLRSSADVWYWGKRPCGVRIRQPTGRSKPGEPYCNRKSTRLNSSHGYISYAVFCLKKKTKHILSHRLHMTQRIPIELSFQSPYCLL